METKVLTIGEKQLLQITERQTRVVSKEELEKQKANLELQLSKINEMLAQFAVA